MAAKCCNRKVLLLLAALMMAAAGSARRHIARQRLKAGDLLFHITQESNAITSVTPGMTDHVAIYLGNDSVIEAVGRGVVKTPLDSLLSQPGHYVAARVRKADRRRSLANACRYLGRAYDWLYLSDNEDIYCSELVQLSFEDKAGRRLFPPIAMSFHDSTGTITPYWQQFYARRGMAVPEGQPGTNPGELLQRSIVRHLGIITPQ